MKKVLIYLCFAVLVCIGCKDEPTPPEQLPEGYQQDIPWPSLADTPWPVFLGTAQGTNRTKSIGPIKGTVEWINQDMHVSGGITLGYNNDVYVASPDPKGIYRLELTSGKQMWKQDSIFFHGPIDVHPCPIILKDSSIIATTGNLGKIFSLRPNGKLLWSYDANSEIYNRGIGIGKDGTIYFIDHSKTLHALNVKGILLWKIQDLRFRGNGNFTLVFSPDGKTLYFPGNKVGLVAFDLEKRIVKWTFGNDSWSNYPLVDSEGNIYILSGYSDQDKNPSLYSLKSDGSIRWLFPHNNKVLAGSTHAISMNSNGDIYFGYYDSLYCVNYNGKLKFKNGFGADMPILIDGQDNIYFYSYKINSALKLDKLGNLIWKTEGAMLYPAGFGCLSNGRWLMSNWQYSKYIISIN